MGHPVYNILRCNRSVDMIVRSDIFYVCSHSYSSLQYYQYKLLFSDRRAINILSVRPGGDDSSSCKPNKDRLPFQIGHLYSVLYG